MRTTKDFVFFFTGEDVFSNFYPIRFVHQGHRFRSAEQAVMYRKAQFFGNDTIAQQILDAKTAKEAKQLGRSRTIAFVEAEWVSNRERIYREVLMDKFSIPFLKESLVETGARTLVEASPYDTIWGVGLAQTDPRILYPNQWKGQNLLGRVLMDVRAALQHTE